MTAIEQLKQDGQKYYDTWAALRDRAFSGQSVSHKELQSELDILQTWATRNGLNVQLELDAFLNLPEEFEAIFA